jgi:hypothetical protein
MVEKLPMELPWGNDLVVSSFPECRWKIAARDAEIRRAGR